MRRRGFLRLASGLVLGAIVAPELDPEQLRRFWPGWAPSGPTEPFLWNYRLQLHPGQLEWLDRDTSALKYVQRLDGFGGYRTFETDEGIVRRVLADLRIDVSMDQPWAEVRRNGRQIASPWESLSGGDVPPLPPKLSPAEFRELSMADFSTPPEMPRRPPLRVHGVPSSSRGSARAAPIPYT